jgi:Isochorismatase family
VVSLAKAVGRQVANQGEVPVPFDDGLLVDADVTRHARALGAQAALDGPLQDGTGLVPADAQDPGGALDVGPRALDDPRCCVTGTWGAEFLGDVVPVDGELVIVKHRYSAFVDTRLELILRANRIRTSSSSAWLPRAASNSPRGMQTCATTTSSSRRTTSPTVGR